MAGQDHSFDIVSKVDHQEVDNAVNQAAKEVGQRFDFKGTETAVRWAGDGVEIESSTEDRARAALEVFSSKLARRGVSLKALTASEPRVSGKRSHISCTFAHGISQDNAKKIGKLVRDDGPKTVRVLIQGDELRVTSKSLDDLQAVQELIRQADYDFAVQFVNYR